MKTPDSPPWLDWARRLQAIAHNGLAYAKDPFDIYRLFILCRLTGGMEKLSVETDGVAFFGEEAIPPLSLSRVLPAQIHRMFEHLRNPDLPTEMDW